MFCLFKKSPKRYKPLSDYPERWSLLQEDARGLVLRVNLGYADSIGHPDYPIKMGIAIPIRTEHDEYVSELKESVEVVLDEILSNGEKGAFVAVITGLHAPKFVEFLAYAKKDLDFAAIHQTLKVKFPDFEVQMYANADPGWNTYRSFLR